MSLAFTETLRSLDRDRPHWSSALTAIAAAVLTPWCLWFFFSEVGVYAKAQPARLVSASAPHAVESQASGPFLEAHVSLGDRVVEGDILFQLDTTSLRLERERADAELRALTSEIEAVESELEARAHVRQLGNQLAEIRKMRAREKVKVAASDADLEQRRAQHLRSLSEQGFASSDQAAEAASTAKMKSSTARRARAGVRLEELLGRHDASDSVVDRRQLQRLLAQLEGRRAVLRVEYKALQLAIDRASIRAPVSGTVGEVTEARPGSVVDAGEALASIVPDGSLVVEAHLSNAIAGHVRAGDRAVLRLTGFPWPEYGSLHVTILRVGSESSTGGFRALLELTGDGDYEGPLEHGLPGELLLETDRSTPFMVLLRSLGVVAPAAEGTNPA